MSMIHASESADLAIENELETAQSLGLIETADVLDGVETNLQLLNQHFEIVASALLELDHDQT
ncbi:MAG: hypothetical protein AAFY82_02980 [Pseudomonadota bacterium]